jgi:hypothetical protein
MLRASDADLMVAGLEAEAPGQSAAAGLQLLETGTSLLEQVRVGIPAHDRVVVAMHSRQHPPGNGWRLPVRSALGQEFGEGDHMVA